MITEDYVSFETAKLLKERGFNDRCRAFWKVWNGNTTLIECNSAQAFDSCYNSTLEKYNDEGELNIAASTLQMAMKWLREVHNLCLEPYRTACGYLCDVARVPTGSEIYGQEYEGDDEDSGQFTTYEKSCEAAIKYCLENLI